ncbi:MAG: NAD(P)H-binding protein [Bacteroidota bacterium]
MILVTGATGFIGRSLVRELSQAGYPLRALIRPSRRTPRLPKSVPIEVAVASLADTRGLRAALNNVDVVIHLASAESQGRRADLRATDIEGTRNLVEAAADAGVQRFIYVSHLGAERASAYPVFKAKGIAEEHIRRSSIPYTILRSSLVYGPEDHFTTGLARMLRAALGVFFIPGGGRTVLQPFWVEDLVACLLWSLEAPETSNQTYEVGGSEYFTVRQVIEILMPIIHARRYLVELPIVVLRALVVFLESFVPRYPASSFWVDYISISRTCAADSTARAFGLMPARFTYRLDYLAHKPWWRRLAEAVSATRQNAFDWLRQRLPRAGR